MKKIVLIIVIILTLLGFFKTYSDTEAAGSNPYCLGASGTFTAVNWPSGQTIDVACAGDTGTAGCTGHVVTLSPGQSYDFNNCTCSPYGTIGDNGNGLTGGCIYVGRDLRIVQQNNGNRIILGDTSLPTGCTLQGGNPIACGANGQVIHQSINITCIGPTPTKTPTPSSTPLPSVTKTPTPSSTPVPSSTITPSPTLTITPSPSPTTTSCPIPDAPLNVRIQCPFCGL